MRTVGMLTDIERGGVSNELPLSTEIISTIQNRRALYVAAFLHDIGKGRIEDHSIVGARIARKLCPRLGLTPAETETVAWLIEQHLTMSNIAQSRDLSDPKTIRDFADVVQSPERLEAAAAADRCRHSRRRARRVERLEGPAAAHALLRDRAAGRRRPHAGEAQPAHRRGAGELLRRDLAIGRRPRSIASSTGTIPTIGCAPTPSGSVEHAKLLRRAENEGPHVATDTRTDAFTAITELTVVAPNHPRLLSLFAGACAAAGANIAGAHIMTTRDGFALDTFLLNREFTDDEDELRRGKRIGDTHRPPAARRCVARRSCSRSAGAPPRRVMAFTVEPDVIINNALSDQFTVIEVAGRDRPGCCTS